MLARNMFSLTVLIGATALAATRAEAQSVHQISNIDILRTSLQVQWFGTAPLCKGQCPQGEYELWRNDRGDGKACWSGEKALCSKLPPYRFSSYWQGTAFLCAAGPQDCGNDIYLQDDNAGDGKACMTGHKVRCVAPKEVDVACQIKAMTGYLGSIPKDKLSPSKFDPNALSYGGKKISRGVIKQTCGSAEPLIRVDVGGEGLQKHGADIFGFANVINMNTKVVDINNKNIKNFFPGSSENLPFADHSIDELYAQNIPFTLAAQKEFVRVITKNGSIFLTGSARDKEIFNWATTLRDKLHGDLTQLKCYANYECYLIQVHP